MNAPASAPPARGHGLSARAATLGVMPEWRLAPAEPAAVSRLAREAGVSALLARLLLRRGVETADGARAYLDPCRGVLHDPSLLTGADEAADLLVSTAARGKRVVVFGDYDVDGVTAVAQLRAALRRIGADAAAFIPHRLRDGYGLKPDTVRRVLAELSPATIVSVDCGITAIEGVAFARAAGVEVIVTDHHLVPKQLPAGAVVVNPKQPDCAYPYPELAATGIAMKIAQAVARRGGATLSLKSLLRIACLGTIADLVPLDGENRTIAALGLAALATSRAPGLRALLAEAGLAPGTAPTAEEVAFRLAPRLNAAGRIDSAHLALSLFEERDAARGEAVARELSSRNEERRELERKVVAEARARIEDAGEKACAALVVEADPGWHRGVLGIAASRLAREYHRPVLLFGIDGETAIGSGRSIPGVSLYGLLEDLGARFTEFGGHAQAVGGSMPASRFAAFRAEARAHFAARIPPEALVRVEEAEAELPLDAVSDELLADLRRLEPHGAGNPRPVFYVGGAEAAGPFSPAGTSGLSGRLRTGPGQIRCIAWGPGETLAVLAATRAPMDLLVRLEPGRNGWGKQVEILAARPAGSRP